MEDEILIDYDSIDIKVFHKYNQIFNDHFDDLALIDFIFGFYKSIYIGNKHARQKERITFKNAKEFNDYLDDIDESTDSD